MPSNQSCAPYGSKSLLEKLGVRETSRVGIRNIQDADFLERLRERTEAVFSNRLPNSLDFIFYGADRLKELEKLPALKAHLKSNGGIWIVTKKGKAATLRDVDVIAAAKRAGLVDNKVVSFSETHTALRLVVPLAQRKAF